MNLLENKAVKAESKFTQHQHKDMTHEDMEHKDMTYEDINSQPYLSTNHKLVSLTGIHNIIMSTPLIIDAYMYTFMYVVRLLHMYYNENTTYIILYKIYS